MKYRISRRANNDLESIWKRISRDNPDAADRLDARFHHSIKLLARFPGMGHQRPDVDDKRYCFWAVGNYIVAYRMEKKVLMVIRVLHGARDFRKLFKRRK